MNVKDLIPQIPIFATLEEEEMLVVKDHIEVLQLKPEAVIFEEKDPGNGLYVVAIGAVKIIKKIDASNIRTLAGIMEKDFFGEMALLDGQPRSAGAAAARDSVVLKISNEHFHNLMMVAPFAAMKIISQIACVLAMRLRQTNMKLAEAENYRLLRSG